MNEIFVPLQLTPGLAGIFLRPLCGNDELLINNQNTRNAIELVDRLIIRKQLPDKFTAADLVTADRDRIMARIYIETFGQKIDSTIACEQCEQQYDLDFSLKELLDHYSLADVKSNDGTYSIDSGSVFRLPTGVDELKLEAFDDEAAEIFLRNSCLISGQIGDEDAIQQRMAELAPVLNIDMQSSCPECGHTQEIHFDVQSFLLMKMQQEQQQVIQEIHRIASSYHWTPDIILALPRVLRKKYVSLIESETRDQ